MPKRQTNTRAYYKRLRLHYQKQAYTRLNKEFKKLFNSIPYDNLTYDFPAPVIALNINEDSLKDSLEKMYLDIGLKYGKHINRDIEKEQKRQGIVLQTKAKPYELFSEKFIKWVRDYLRGSGGNKIVSLTDTMTKKVIRTIEEAQAKGLTQDEMRIEIRKQATKSTFYRGQIMRIVRTETAMAMNTASQVSFETSSIEMEKEWILGGSANHRPDHVQMDGVRVPWDEDFVLPSGESLRYPCDPNGAPEEIINCSCSSGYVPVRNASGGLVFKG